MRTFIVLVLIAGAIGCGETAPPVGDDDGIDPPADASVDDDPDAGPPDAVPATCGNGTVETGETCDDGNAATEACAYGETGCTVCDATCHEGAGLTSYCGDSTTDAANSEACDDGNTDTEACAYGLASCLVCAADCTLVAGATSYCNDGVTDAAAGETCEDGNATTETCAYGETSCTVCDAACHTTPGATSYCGDNATDDTNSEQCDDGNAATELCAYGETGCTVCDATCQAVAGNTSYCGDGITDGANAEACDDSNAATETCPYGNTAGCTVCDATCQEAVGAISYCGDGVTDGAAGETCDDSNATTEACAYGEASCTVCDAACHSVAGATSLCGDGVRDAANGEACDDGNGITEDGCEPTCELICGADTTASRAWMTDFGCVLRHDTPANSTNAALTCAAEGGELATVLSAAQNDALTARITSATALIGFTDAATEGTWLWRSGAQNVYTNWATNEPNNSSGNEDCLQLLTTGRWNDVNCASSFPYLCLIPTCGNGTTDAGEACDDTNRTTETCAYDEPACTVCSATCESVDGAVRMCGDDNIDPEEECDGTTEGCVDCTIASGWVCSGEPSTCIVGDTWDTGTGLNAAIPDDGYNGTLASMRCVSIPVTATGNGIVTHVSVTLGMTHTFLGDLVIKLVDPTGTVVTLMSRPGATETVDNGTNGSAGESGNISATHPITFRDGAAVSAESMGSTTNDSNAVVCRDDGRCEYAPFAGIATPGTLASFVGSAAAGTWQLCVGDNFSTDVGTIDRVALTIGQDAPHCGDGLVDAGEACDDGNGDDAACDGLCTATADLGVRLLQHCDATSDPVATLTGAGCHTLDDAARTQASSLVYDFPGTAILYEAAGCAGQSYTMEIEDNFCSLTYPSGSGLNDNVGSIWLEP